MAISGIKPFVHVSDANGKPYVGAVLKVYQPGTTNLASIYTDAGLSIAAPNPMTGASGSDASGNFPHWYIAAGNYKLRAETSTGVLIWEVDNLDTGLSAGSGALPIASGGTGGTTATAALANLGAASTSDVTALATSIASILSTLQNIVSMPQGRLTPTSAIPVIISDAASATLVYYTPYVGNLIPIYDGSQFNTIAFAELTLTLNANHPANNIYDVFVFKDSGITLLGTGPAWNVASAGSGSRGAGAGTTELTRTKGGLWTNAFSMTARNGATTYTVNANCGTYVGSLFIDGSNGQVSCHRSYGSSRKFGIWNAYNRVPIFLKAGDSTGSWTETQTIFGLAHSLSTNSLNTFTGLAECQLDFRYTAQVATGGVQQFVGIGFNSITVASGMQGNNPSTSATVANTPAFYTAPPSLGINLISCLNRTASGTVTWFGNEANMLLLAQYLG